MAIYCFGCGKDITEFIEKYLPSFDYSSVDDLRCAECYKKDEQLNKRKYDE